MTITSRPSVTLRCITFLPAAALALLAGCGQVHGSIPVDSTASDIAQTVCSSAYRCCTLAQLMSNDAAGTSAATAANDCTSDSAACEQACETKTAENFRNELSGVQSSVDRKRAVYEQTKVDACLSKLRSSTCETINVTNHLTGVPGCESFVTPLVPVGGNCTNDYECVDGWCKPPTGSDTGEGTCAALAQAGGSCTENKNCAPGLSCYLNSSDPPVGVCLQGGGSSATGEMCFYSSGCSIAGGRPGSRAALGLAVFALIALARGRRGRRR
jgi:hypothetical protein